MPSSIGADARATTSDCSSRTGFRRTTTWRATGRRGARAAGISYRQLDYWARTELVEPTVRGAAGSGSQRLYGFRDILVLKLVKRLLDTGISLQQIRVAVTQLREAGIEDLAQTTLMSDGASVYLCTSDDEVIDLVNRGQGVFGIAVRCCARSSPRSSNSTRSPPTTSTSRGTTRPVDAQDLLTADRRRGDMASCDVSSDVRRVAQRLGESSSRRLPGSRGELADAGVRSTARAAGRSGSTSPRRSRRATCAAGFAAPAPAAATCARAVAGGARADRTCRAAP